MNGWLNCGAYGRDGQRIRTKTQLKAELADAPEVVYFDATGMFAGTNGYSGHVIPVGLKLSVVGPDPYRDRRWYATVTRAADGKVTVK